MAILFRRMPHNKAACWVMMTNAILPSFEADGRLNHSHAAKMIRIYLSSRLMLSAYLHRQCGGIYGRSESIS